MSTAAQTLDAQELVNRAIRAPLVVRPVVPAKGRPIDAANWWVHLPPHRPRPAPDLQVMVRELRRWTGWSSRALADALGTSHTTVQAMESGRAVTWRSGNLRQRLYEVHEVVSRVDVLAGGSAVRVDEILRHEGEDGASALSHIQAGQPAQAYLSAIDAVRPRRRTGLLVGTRPTKAGTATAALEE